MVFYRVPFSGASQRGSMTACESSRGSTESAQGSSTSAREVVRLRAAAVEVVEDGGSPNADKVLERLFVERESSAMLRT